MQNYLDLLQKVLNEGEERDTRSGKVYSIFGENLTFDLRKGFPTVTTKKLAFKSMVGELLWFLAGHNNLVSLRKFSDIKQDGWTIWTEDLERWGKTLHPSQQYLMNLPQENLGKLYGAQWRSFDGGIDQIENLIKGLIENPMSRYHIVTAWNPADKEANAMALPACHVLFQCYVTTNGYLDLIWHQRSVDSFLGL